MTVPVKPSEIVSIIIPTYKRPTNLERAINSAVNQTYEFIEVIVVDDNDPNTIYREQTEIIANKYNYLPNFKYVKHSRNLNGAAARNTGVKHADGDYIAFLDDDDEFYPDKISLQISALKTMPESFAAVYSGYILRLENRIIREKYELPAGNLQLDLLKMTVALKAGSTLLIKKSVFSELHGFDTSFSRHQDYELLIRYFEKYKIGVVKKILVSINIDDPSSVPDGNKLTNIKEQYLRKFNDIISKYSKKNQNEIYQSHYCMIAKAFIVSKNYGNALVYIKKLIRYKPLKSRNIKLLLKTFLGMTQR